MSWFRKGVLVGFLLVLLTIRQLPDGKLHLIFCDVGQGDASLIIKGDFQMLIDTGPKNGGVVDCLGRHLPFWDKKIEVLLNSHPELDHLGDLEGVAEHYQIGQLVLDGKIPRGRSVGVVKELVEGGTKLTIGKKSDRLRYGDLYFDVLWPEEKQGELLAYLHDGVPVVLGSETGLNQFSLVTLMSYGRQKVLFTGDVSGEEEAALLSSGSLVPVDVLKAAHHGSRFSTTDDFVEATRPGLTVFSVGKNNYGHPTQEALGRVERVGSLIWRTDKQGELELVFDGKSYALK